MFPAITIGMLILTSLVSLLEVPFPGTSSALSVVPPLFVERPWILVTAMFVHANLGHLMQNMLALVIFGSFLERVIKWQRWLAVYLASGIAGNVAGLVFYPQSMSLGASGAIMGLVGTLTLLRPKATVWFGAEMPVVILSAIFILTDLVGLFVPSDIGNASHLAGFVAGAAFGWAWRKKFSTKKEIRARIRKAIR